MTPTSDSETLLNSVVVEPDASVNEALARMNLAGTGGLVLCTAGRKLAGLLTDGDIRRALLRRISLEDPCRTIANLTPITAQNPISAGEALYVMSRHDIDHLPVIDERGVLEDFLLRRNIVDKEDLEESARRWLDSVIMSPGISIADAISQMDGAGTGGLVICAAGRRLLGVLTDGDIRRAILRGVPLTDPCESIAVLNPLTAVGSISPRDARRLMREHDINHLPVVDTDGNLVEFVLRKDLTEEDQPHLSAVIMAGGFGKRLLPLTERVPKPMLPVGDHPLLERTIERLQRSGIRDVSLATHYLSESIVQHFGDGAGFGVRIRYSNEDQPLGTAGGLKLLPRPEGTLLVINGDILTGVSFREMLSYHRQHSAEITVGVRQHNVEVPFGVVDCDGLRITQLREKPSLSVFINAGIYLLEPSACDYIPDGTRFDMTDLIKKMIDEGRSVVSFPIIEYWQDVGRLDDYQQAQEDVRTKQI